MKDDNVLDRLSGFGRDEFADWLWTGLREFYASPPSERARSFGGAGLEILQRESICEGLAQIYERYVPGSKQLLFRKAIGDVLRRHANDGDAPVDGILDLVYLIMRVRADESLDALVPTVGNGFLGQKYPKILYATITSLRSLAPSMQAYKTALNLIRSTNFDKGYLFEALKVLVECRPTDISRTLVKFEPPLSDLCRLAEETNKSDERAALLDAVSDWVRFLFKYNPAIWLPEFWEKADHTAQQLWLFKQIYCNEAIPTSLYHNRDTDRYFVRYQNSEIPLRMPRKTRWTCESLLERSMYQRSNQWCNSPNDSTYTRIHEWVRGLRPIEDSLECQA
jgi:hypothetical protein